MILKTLIFSLPLLLIGPQSFADSTTDAIIGGGLGGAVGAAIGNELGGRDGAILGGALGGATGAAITTQNDRYEHNYYRPHVRYDYRPVRYDYRQHARYDYREHDRKHNKGYFCPPGQKKKGRC